MFQKSITSEEIKNLPTAVFSGEIVVVDNLNQINKAVDYLFQFDLLGFDTETRPSFKKGVVNPVALIQLAAPERVFLFRINKTGYHDSLNQLFLSSQVIKVGNAIKDDLVKLKNVGFSYHRDSFLDLTEIVKKMGFKKTGLRNLAGIVLGKRITKNEQTSNWEREKLTSSQIKYAAMDAWICREIYLKILENGIFDGANLADT